MRGGRRARYVTQFIFSLGGIDIDSPTPKGAAMSQSVDRLENLIRVLHAVAPDQLNMSNWCNCAVGHASRDQYFIDEGLPSPRLQIQSEVDNYGMQLVEVANG
jgi:hypothetical protein